MDLFKIWNSRGLYTFAEELNSIPHLLHIQEIFSGFDIKLHFLFKHIKYPVDKFKYKIFLHLIHFIISFIIELQ